MNTTSGLQHLSFSTLKWHRLDVHGTEMDKAVLFEGGHDVRSAFYRMQPGQIIKRHTHTKWVQVAVFQGCMRVEQEGSEDIQADVGTVYFVNPHYPHVETALVETIILVTQGEDRPGWM